MSVLIDENTKVITQGITGKTGQFHTRACREYGNGRAAYVAGVHPKRAGEDFEGIPIFGTVKEAKEHTGATVSVIYVPPAGAAAAIYEALEAELDLVICITEGIPVRDMIEIKYRMRHYKQQCLSLSDGEIDQHADTTDGWIGCKTKLLGPNCPGIIKPGPKGVKIGIMPGHIHQAGKIGVVSRSGTLTYEAVSQLTALGLGQSCAVGIGGDPVGGLKHIDMLKLFNEDPETEAVVMIGEIGGEDEEIAARWAAGFTDDGNQTGQAVANRAGSQTAHYIKRNMTKPVVGFIAGVSAPPGKRMGHAGAIISGGKGTADEKLQVMEACGFKVTRNPSEIGQLLKSVL